MAGYGDTSVDMMLNVLPGTFTGIFALNAGLSSINQTFQNMTKGIDNHFGLLDAALVSATALAVQFGKGAADAFGEYEQGMKIVQAVSGQSSAAIAELGQKANEFSVQYRMDIADLTEGLQTLGRAGLKSASEQTEVLESGLQTAKLEGRDLNSVLEELIQNTTLLGGDLKSSNFGEQSEYVNDLLVATSMTAPINTHDVSETLKYSGGIAAAAGANIETDEGKEILEDYMGTIAAFAQKGVKGSISGTALRAFFNKPATQDASVLEGLSMIGLKPEYLWEDDQETMKPVSEQISLIQSQMDKKGISQMDRLQIWSKIVGGKMGQQMMKLDGSDIREITKDIKEANSAENLATQSMQTYQSAMKQAGEAGQLAFREFGEHVARFLTPVAKIITPILEALSNPIVSTAAFAAFLKLISLAWNSIRKIFTGVRAELAILRTEFTSMILNQDTRKNLMGGHLWGNGPLENYKRNLMEASQEVNEISQKTNQTSAVAKESSGVVLRESSQLSTKVSDIYRVMTATLNAIKEEMIKINSSILTEVQKIRTSIGTSIKETSTQMNRDFSNVINSVGTKANTMIRNTATKAKTEFQMALNSLTYTPKISPSAVKGAYGSVGYHTDMGSQSYFVNRQMFNNLRNQESKYQQGMSDLEKRRSNVILSSKLQGSLNSSEKYHDGLKEESLRLKEDIAKIDAELMELSAILEKDGSQLSKAQKEKLMKDKANAEQEQTILLNKRALLEEERNYVIDEIGLHRSLVQELRNTINQLKKERLSLINQGKSVLPTTKAGVGLLPGTYNPSSIPTNLRPIFISESDLSRSRFGYGSYGYYNAKSGMPAAPGNFNWSYVPKEYHPSLFMTNGSVASSNFKNLDRGQGLIANLRQQEIAMTKEMQKELGITNKELIRFYEELVQVNAALAKTTTVANGKATTRNGMAAEQKFQEKLANDTLYKTKGNLVPINTTGTWTARDRLGLKALFGDLSKAEKEAFERMYNKTDVAKHQQEYLRQQKYLQTVGGYTRYNLPPNSGQTAVQVQQGKWENQRANEINSAGNPAAAMTLMNQMKTEEELNKQKQENLNKEKERIQKNRDLRSKSGLSGQLSRFKNSLTGGTKGLKGLGNALSKTVNFMGGPFFAGLMAIDVAMQVYTSLHNAYIKKVEEATQKIDEMTQAVSDAENVFFNGRDEEGLPKITGWSEEHPDATAEEKEDALLGAYSEIYDHSTEGLSALDANTQQLAIATEELKIANQGNYAYMEDKNFGPKGRVSEPFRQDSSFSEDFGEDGSLLKEAAVYLNDLVGKPTSSYTDKYGLRTGSVGASFMETGEIHLDDWQKAEEFPWSTEFAPILASDVWKAGSGKDGIKVMLGDTGFKALKDQYSSLESEQKLTGVHGQGGTISAYDQSAWNVHGKNIENYFGDKESQNKLQMGLKNFSKDFSKLAKQTRRFEKATGRTALGSLQNEMKKTKNMKQALKNLQVTDPKLVNYIKSLAIKTGMDEQQVLMAAQLQQLQDMQEIANTQITPRMESVVGLAYQQVAYGGQTLGEVGSSGAGAVSAAQNAAAIAALLNAKMETSLDERGYKQWIKDHPNQEDPYGDAAHFAAARDAAHDDGVTTEMDKYYEDWAKSYAATNMMMYNPDLSAEDAAKKAEEWYKGAVNSSASATYDTLRKGGIGALKKNILSAYDSSLDQEEGGGGSGGGGGGGSGSGSGDKDKNTGTRRERVDLVLCSKKEIPKLNVNLFKKPPSFTILNKNFKLRDVKINSEDKPKAIMAAIKNSFIDIQKRTDPKIIQDEDAVYDPKAATDGTNVPSGTAKTKTDNNN